MNSVKEKEVTGSSYESELIVQNKVCQKGIKTFMILEELGIAVPKPMTMYSDNEAAVLTANQKHINKMGRSKFMNRKIFYLHDEVIKGNIKPTWIATEEMDADIGTKHLKGSHYDYLSNRSFSRLYYDQEFKEDFEVSPNEYSGVYIDEIADSARKDDSVGSEISKNPQQTPYQSPVNTGALPLTNTVSPSQPRGMKNVKVGRLAVKAARQRRSKLGIRREFSAFGPSGFFGV
jgi:hypothetical protein